MKKQLLSVICVLALFKIEAQNPMLKIADSILNTGDYQLALIKLQEVENPSSSILERIASTYQKVGNHSKAISYYNKAYTLNPSDKIKERLGVSYQFMGNVPKTIALYQEVLEENPNNLLLKYTLAKLYMGERQVKKAIHLFAELSGQDPKNPNYHYYLGLAYDKVKKDPSIGFLKAFELDSTHLKSMYRLAKFYRAIDVRDSASLFIDKGLEINPESINFNQLKAKDAFYKKEYDVALKHLDKLDTLGFKTLFTYKMYGLTYLKLEDFENAETYFLKAKEKDIQDDEVHYNLGIAYANLKKYKKAQMAFMMSMYLQKPQLDKHYYHLGMLQLSQKEQKKAIKLFEKGLESNPRNKTILFQIALATDSYYKDKKIALKQYKRYLDRFQSLDREETAYVERRVKEIKKALFIKGEKVE